MSMASDNRSVAKTKTVYTREGDRKHLLYLSFKSGLQNA